jgi:hypothetical protein
MAMRAKQRTTLIQAERSEIQSQLRPGDTQAQITAQLGRS